jgi:hypothetical protein
VEGEFTALTARLDHAIGAMTLDPESLRRAERGDAAATRQLFDQVAAGRGGNRRRCHDLRRCQPTPGMARPIRGCS